MDTDIPKKLWRFLRSMRFALVLLGLMVLACLAGSLIPQGNGLTYYQQAYPRMGGVILALGLDHVFRSLWFLGLTGLLCLNLILCSLIRLPALIRQTREGDPPAWERTLLTGGEEETARLFAALGFRRTERTQYRGRPAIKGEKNRAGRWGSWLCHLGILIVIVGFGFGQLLQFESYIYGIPGDLLPVADTPYAVLIDDFQVLLREDETVDQYRTELTVVDTSTGERASGRTAVNHPLSRFGLKFYQNSTGWGAYVDVIRGGETVQRVFLCAGEWTEVEAKAGLTVQLRAFYPDYVTDETGRPATASSALKNPAYLYLLGYEGEVLGMNVLRDGEPITVDDVTILFHDPRPYTLLQIKRDPLEKLTLAGGVVILCALLLAFYLQPAQLWAWEDEEGIWQVGGRRPRGEAMFREELLRRGTALGLKKREEEGT